MSAITSIFHPLLSLLAVLVAYFYSITSNFAISIALLTILVYLLLTPLLVKQTRSMIEMQRIQPEIAKIRQKYKGPGNAQEQQQEMMALYKAHNVNPMGGCLPMLVQFPVLFVMYAVIRGLLNKLSIHGKAVFVHGQPVASPEYVSHTSTIYKTLVLSHGKMMSFGVDLSLPASGHHGSFFNAFPYYFLVVLAAVLSLLQIQQMTIRNRKIMTQTPQMLQMQKMQYITPLIMTVIYWRLPVALSVYFIASSLFRIAQQELMYRYDPVLSAHVRVSMDLKNSRAASKEEKSDFRVQEPNIRSFSLFRQKAASEQPELEEPESNVKPQHPRSKSKRRRKER